MSDDMKILLPLALSVSNTAFLKEFHKNILSTISMYEELIKDPESPMELIREFGFEDNYNTAKERLPYVEKALSDRNINHELN